MTNDQPPTVRRHTRRIKLIKARIQIRLIAWFASMAAISLLFQFTLLGLSLSELAMTMPAGGDYLSEATPGMLLRVLALSFGVLLPLICGLGVLVTFRLAGPIYRFEQHLGAVARGEDPGPCRIRQGDELHELCGLINSALETAHGRESGEAVRSERPEPIRAAS
jgi:hypothetical protein